MNTKLVNELEILHEVSENKHLNQKYLSKKLGISSGLVNLYIKRLASKGYIKIKGIKPRRVKYLITPTGIAEKSRLTYEFAIISYKYLKKTTDDLRERLYDLKEAGQEKVVVFGTGELAKLCLLLIKEVDMRVVAIVKADVTEVRFEGYPVVPPEVLQNMIFDKVIVAETDGRHAVLSLLEKAGTEKDKVMFPLLVVPPHEDQQDG